MFKLGHLVRATVLGFAVSSVLACAVDASENERVEVETAAGAVHTRGGRVATSDGRGELIANTPAPAPVVDAGLRIATGAVNTDAGADEPESTDDGKADLVVGASAPPPPRAVDSGTSIATNAVNLDGGAQEQDSTGDGKADLVVGSSPAPEPRRDVRR